jgi:hypothetical protein
VNLEELEKLARAATPGPWKWNDTERDNYEQLSAGRNAVLFAAPCGYENSYVVIADADAAYLAALSPTTVLALLAVAKAAREWRALQRGQHTSGPQHALAVHDARARLQSAIDALDAGGSK